MNQMEEAKRNYDAVPIPQELSERVLSEIKKADLRRKGIRILQKKRMANGQYAAGYRGCCKSPDLPFMGNRDR